MGLFNKRELLRISELEKELRQTKDELSNQKKYNDEIGVSSIVEARNKMSEEKENHNNEILKFKKSIDDLLLSQEKHSQEFNQLKINQEIGQEEYDKINNQVQNQTSKLQKLKELNKAINSFNTYETTDEKILERAELLAPTVISSLNCLDNQELRKKYRENEKNIKIILEKYESRYNTKANKTIYKLMVIALQSELQNIMTEMKYDKLDVALDRVKEICQKYYLISSEGNQTIASTVQKFISEVEYLFINAVSIEYEYYIKKEQEKQEQSAIREQMRQETAERKELERQQKQVEKEESKFTNEIENLKLLILEEAEDKKINALQAKIDELNAKLEKVHERKEEIINRQNGKAGNVYIISNIGSFGKDIFKVGMTRRLEPTERVNELGDASVPFKFDIHAMIFSEDAVALESKLHSILNEKRVNKVNMRKEFFRVPLDEIEEIVISEEPTSNFKKTILALEYKQTLSIEERGKSQDLDTPLK